MLAGFAAAFLIGDMFLAVRGAATTSVEFLYGVAGFSLAQVFWTLGQLREARPDIRVFFAAAVPLSLFVLCRLHPPVLAVGAVHRIEHDVGAKALNVGGKILRQKYTFYPTFHKFTIFAGFNFG